VTVPSRFRANPAHPPTRGCDRPRGFPDSPYSYRYLLPALPEAGYGAVASFNRGFAPTELPDDRHHVHTSMLVNDQIALYGRWPAPGHRWGQS
jgi:hypothetical protein